MSVSVSCLPREKKREQEREELWKKLEELRLSNTALVQNNSHGLQNAQNNNNNNNSNDNNHHDHQDKSTDVAATSDHKDPAVTVETNESTQ